MSVLNKDTGSVHFFEKEEVSEEHSFKLSIYWCWMFESKTMKSCLIQKLKATIKVAFLKKESTMLLEYENSD